MALGLALGYGPAGGADALHQLMQQRLVARDLEQQQARDLARTDLQKQGLALDRQALIDRNAATVADRQHRDRMFGLTEREIAQAAEAAAAEARDRAARAARDQERIDLERQRVDLSRLTESRLGEAAERSAAEAAAARAREASEAEQARQEALAAQQAIAQQRDVWQSIVTTRVNPFTGQPASPELVQDAMRGLLGLREISRSQGESGGDVIDQIIGQALGGATGDGGTGGRQIISGLSPVGTADAGQGAGRQVIAGLSATGGSAGTLRQQAIAFLSANSPADANDEAMIQATMQHLAEQAAGQ